MIKKILLIFIIFSFYIFFSSKKDYGDITQMTYVSSMGIDYKDNQYEMVLYLLNSFSLSKSDYSSSSDALAYTVTGKGETIEKAIISIITNLNIILKWSHIETLILTESFIKSKNYKELTTSFRENYNIYETFVIYFTQEELSKIYQIKFFADISSYYTILTQPKQLKYINLPTYIDFIHDLENENYFCYYPLLKIQKDTISDGKQQYPTLYLEDYAYLTDNGMDIIELKKEPLINFTRNSFEKIATIDNKNYKIYRYFLFKVKVGKKMFLFYYLNVDKEIKLEDKLKKYIIEERQKGIDFYNLNYYDIKDEDLHVKGINKIKKGSAIN